MNGTAVNREDIVGCPYKRTKPPEKVRGRRTLPAWPEEINYAQPDPCRFARLEDDACLGVLRLLALLTILVLAWLLFEGAADLWLRTPNAWAALARAADWVLR